MGCCKAKWGRQVPGVAWRSDCWPLETNARPVSVAGQAQDEYKKAKDGVDGDAQERHGTV